MLVTLVWDRHHLRHRASRSPSTWDPLLWTQASVNLRAGVAPRQLPAHSARSSRRPIPTAGLPRPRDDQPGPLHRPAMAHRESAARYRLRSGPEVCSATLAGLRVLPWTSRGTPRQSRAALDASARRRPPPVIAEPSAHSSHSRSRPNRARPGAGTALLSAGPPRPPRPRCIPARIYGLRRLPLSTPQLQAPRAARGKTPVRRRPVRAGGRRVMHISCRGRSVTAVPRASGVLPREFGRAGRSPHRRPRPASRPSSRRRCRC